MIYYILAPLAVILIGVAKAGFGGGVGIAAVPMFIIATGDPKASLGIMLPLLCACDFFAILHYRNTFDRQNLIRLLPGAILGIAVCGLFLGMIEGKKADEYLQVMIGAISIAFVIYEIIKIRIFKRLEAYKPQAWHGWLFGFSVGITSTLAHAGGPPATMFLLPQHLGRRLFVGTTVFFFTAVNATKLVPYAYHDMINFDSMRQSLFLLPFVPVGTYLGVWMNKRINEKIFTGVIYAILFLIGMKLTIGFDPASYFSYVIHN
ncbi:MAG: sulfite exporter TauE/SafE family protein [Candidatus Omnitrophica bacterium]|nr:sulfite exporter TauE/SafE family protein [Candidatus Omnitrophota bacterium]